MKMLVPSRARSAALAAAAVSALACGDAATLSAPQSAALAPESASLSASHAAHGARVRMPVLRRTKPLRVDEVVCRYIDPVRSTGDERITLHRAGLKVTFPAGSLPGATNVCLTATAGMLLTYTFEPHGLQFNRHIVVEQNLRGTSAFQVPGIAGTLTAGYLSKGVTHDVDAQGVAEFAETFRTRVFDDTHLPTKNDATTATFRTTHFSGYALASGRADSATASH
jgi:hypothetical protein